jgi:hypothetical protein
LPENVSSFFRQGVENYRASRWDASGAMFRKSLDVATRILDPALRSDTLFVRINKLHAQGALTDAIRDWSHEIRLEGNDAVHGDDPETLEDAQATFRFTEAFLIYTFTLPENVRINRAKRSS